MAVVAVDVERDGGRVAHVVTDDETAAACPACGVFSSSVKDRATTRPRDIPYGQNRLIELDRASSCNQRDARSSSMSLVKPPLPP